MVQEKSLGLVSGHHVKPVLITIFITVRFQDALFTVRLFSAISVIKFLVYPDQK